jgi:hypothetical protein
MAVSFFQNFNLEYVWKCRKANVPSAVSLGQFLNIQMIKKLQLLEIPTFYTTIIKYCHWTRS